MQNPPLINVKNTLSKDDLNLIKAILVLKKMNKLSELSKSTNLPTDDLINYFKGSIDIKFTESEEADLFKYIGVSLNPLRFSADRIHYIAMATNLRGRVKDGADILLFRLLRHVAKNNKILFVIREFQSSGYNSTLFNKERFFGIISNDGNQRIIIRLTGLLTSPFLDFENKDEIKMASNILVDDLAYAILNMTLSNREFQRLFVNDKEGEKRSTFKDVEEFARKNEITPDDLMAALSQSVKNKSLINDAKLIK